MVTLGFSYTFGVLKFPWRYAHQGHQISQPRRTCSPRPRITIFIFELYPRIDRSSTLVNSAVLGVPVVAVYVLVFYFVGIASSAMVCPVEVSTFL